jgi:hypothetical protein
MMVLSSTAAAAADGSSLLADDDDAEVEGVLRLFKTLYLTGFLELDEKGCPESSPLSLKRSL